MPLNEVVRRYADRIFQKRNEEIIEGTQTDLVKAREYHADGNVMLSGAYFTAQSTILINQIDLLAQARMESLLTAYEKAGLLFDDNALREITDEVMQFTHARQHNAVGALGTILQRGSNRAPIPADLDKSLIESIVRGTDRIMARLRRDLAIKRDEVLLEEMKTRKVYAAGLGKKWDVFICHASEDKEQFVRQLAKSLADTGLSVWYDEFTLKVGDSLRKKIDEGLANSRYGVVVLSRNFFLKDWPQWELDGLASQEIAGTKVILPVWHDITFENVREKSPILSGRLAAKSSEGIPDVVRQLREAMGL